MTTINEPRAAARSAVDELADRVTAAGIGAYETFTIYLGERVGWYAAMAGAGPLSAAELAARTGTNERYAREWLEQQAASEFVTVAEPAEEADGRRFELPPAAAEVFTDRSSLAYLAPLARIIAASAGQLPALAEAYRTGGGVSWAQFGPDARTGQADMNRPWFERKLPGALRGVPDVHELLDRPGARIADVGCGEGWSSVALARAYPGATVDGYDPDAPSTSAAEANASAVGVADRVRFVTGDAASVLPEETFDAVFAFECLHDLPHPVEVLEGARRSLRPGGVVVVMEEATEEEFSAPAGDVERLLYGYSTLLCLPDAMSHSPSAATGTVIRPSTVREYAGRAGFSGVDVLPIENFGFWRF
jgi:SAM-dependent methyltransferase